MTGAMMQDGAWMMAGMHGLWWFFWLLVSGLLMMFVLRRRSSRRRHSRRETPHQLLRRRLASGEIDSAEYEQRKALLDRDSVLIQDPVISRRSRSAFR